MVTCMFCRRRLPLPPLARPGAKWPVSHYCNGFANPSGSFTDADIRNYLFMWGLEGLT